MDYRYTLSGAGFGDSQQTAFLDNDQQITNYIYLYHIDRFIVLPGFMDSVQDSFSIQWSPSTPLGRSAPIQSFASAGPRTVQVNFQLHRDMMKQINQNISNIEVNEEIGDDYVDTLLKTLQACVVPDYNSSDSTVNPPVVALRLGNDIFIKGVVSSNLGLTWRYPLLRNGKYATVDFNLSITEIEPFDAQRVMQLGSYRYLNTTLDYKKLMNYASSTLRHQHTEGNVGVSLYLRNQGVEVQ